MTRSLKSVNNAVKAANNFKKPPKAILKTPLSPIPPPKQVSNRPNITTQKAPLKKMKAAYNAISVTKSLSNPSNKTVKRNFDIFSSINIDKRTLSLIFLLIFMIILIIAFGHVASLSFSLNSEK